MLPKDDNLTKLRNLNHIKFTIKNLLKFNIILPLLMNFSFKNKNYD